MAKQQTLTIIVGDQMADPADLVETALEHYLSMGPSRPQYGDDIEGDFAAWPYSAYVVLEED